MVVSLYKGCQKSINLTRLSEDILITKLFTFGGRFHFKNIYFWRTFILISLINAKINFIYLIHGK